MSITTLVTVIDGRVAGYWTSSEFAAKTGVKNSTIRMWIFRGKLDALKIGNEYWIKMGTEKPIDKRKRKRS